MAEHSTCTCHLGQKTEYVHILLTLFQCPPIQWDFTCCFNLFEDQNQEMSGFQLLLAFLPGGYVKMAKTSFLTKNNMFFSLKKSFFKQFFFKKRHFSFVQAVLTYTPGGYVKTVKRRKKCIFYFFAKKIYSHEKRRFFEENWRKKMMFLRGAMLRCKKKHFC